MSEPKKLTSPMTMEEAMEKFHKELHKAQEIASPIAAVKVAATVVVQAGQEILVARCPRCPTVAALTGEGKHLCRHCFTWLEYVREG